MMLADHPIGSKSGESAELGRCCAELVVKIARTAAKVELIRADLSIGENLEPFETGQAAKVRHAELLRRVQTRLEDAEEALRAATDELAKLFTELHQAKPRG